MVQYTLACSVDSDSKDLPGIVVLRAKIKKPTTFDLAQDFN